MLSAIVAIDNNNGIGKDNDLLYSNKLDMKRFVEKTKGKTVVMGYKTWISLKKPFLSGRKNVVLLNVEGSEDIPDIFYDALVDVDDIEKLAWTTPLRFIENIKDYLNQTLSYTGAYALYRAVNNDLANTIKAFTVSGYAQGESAFIWYDTKDTENAPLYTEDYIESVLYATWYAIDTVDEHGDYIDSVDVVTYSDYDNSYMLKRFKAVPAATATLLTIL